ncbi:MULTISPECIES: hypothetical protein [unclassified Nostoc]|nr:MULTISPECIES: hypothetical protein [unclassified Nostoc]
MSEKWATELFRFDKFSLIAKNFNYKLLDHDFIIPMVWCDR